MGLLFSQFRTFIDHNIVKKIVYINIVQAYTGVEDLAGDINSRLSLAEFVWMSEFANYNNYYYGLFRANHLKNNKLVKFTNRAESKLVRLT